MHWGRFVVLCFSLLLFLVFCFSSNSLAHNGSRDKLGGHFRSVDCVYILHDPTPLAESARNPQELISLIKQHTSNDCKNSLSESKLDLEGYTFGSGGQSTTGQTNSDSSNQPSKRHSSGLEIGKMYPAVFERCVDGDTAVFKVNGISYNTRFLFIDTPEYTKQKELFGKEASEFTCSFVNQGNVVLETDGKTLFDKYNRLLAWVFVNGQLHQEAITKAGLVEDFYDYGTYKYEELIRKSMEVAKSSYVGMYALSKPVESAVPIEKEDPIVNKSDGNPKVNKSTTTVPSKNEKQETTKKVEVEKNTINSSLSPLIVIFFIGIFLVFIFSIIRKVI